MSTSTDTATAFQVGERIVQRRDLGAHIESALATVEPGEFLTASQISKHVSAEYPNGERPSVGAITARLFPGSGICTVNNVRPESHPVTGAKGAMRVVSFYVGGQRWETAPVRPFVQPVD